MNARFGATAARESGKWWGKRTKLAGPRNVRQPGIGEKLGLIWNDWKGAPDIVSSTGIMGSSPSVLPDRRQTGDEK